MFKNGTLKGHTLVELLVVLGIVSVLALVAIPLFSNYTEQGKIDELKAYLLKAAAAQEKYYANTGNFSPLSTTLQAYGFPTPADSKMKLYTGVIIRNGTGMTYWVAGNYDVNPHVSNTYNECWAYLGSILGTGNTDNFLRLHKETGNKTIDDYQVPDGIVLDNVCK